MIFAINTGSQQNSIALYGPILKIKNPTSRQGGQKSKTFIEDEVVWQSYPTSPRFKSGLRGTSHTQSQELLPKINKLLESHKVKLSNLKAIAVFQGPGSYTGLRVGISVANALAWSLDIPVVEIKIPKLKFQITNPSIILGTDKFQNPNFNVKNQPTNQLSALEIAKGAQAILIKKNRSKFTKLVNPYYGVNKI